eukprot:TRINITY_DN2841_c0_g1_i2.p2 TRINITY_DN2841_c0_g1~~TRINITY_DN2841_c0_g1_i2.p2  ORF type:complete len:134 (+),score=13.91 TRINITY_DN2841_c0_g1_i2:730-1131(+)
MKIIPEMAGLEVLSRHNPSSIVHDIALRVALGALIFQHRNQEYCTLKTYRDKILPTACKICENTPTAFFNSERIVANVTDMLSADPNGAAKIKKINDTLLLFDNKLNNMEVYYQELRDKKQLKHGLKFCYFES